MSLIATLGGLPFTPKIGSVDRIDMEENFPWAQQEAIGSSPVKQWMGPGDQTISLEGECHLELMPGAGTKLTELAALAGTGAPLVFTLGRRVFGLWCLEKISRSGSSFNRRGAPGVLTFTIEISRYQPSAGPIWPF